MPNKTRDAILSFVLYVLTDSYNELISTWDCVDEKLYINFSQMYYDIYLEVKNRYKKIYSTRHFNNFWNSHKKDLEKLGIHFSSDINVEIAMYGSLNYTKNCYWKFCMGDKSIIETNKAFLYR